MNSNKDSRKKIFLLEQIDSHKKKYHFKLAFASAPHPEKVWKGGEDALFVSKNIIIIADGVGGWAKMGIDSGIYARKLIESVKELISNEKQLYFIERPQELAIRAVQQNQEKGSSTLSILTVHPYTGVFRSYHIGDSIYGIFSKERCFFMAEEQQRSFNVPFQVFGGSQNMINSKDSDSQEEQLVSDVFKGVYHQFHPQQLAEKVIVLASDGLWDNLLPNEVRKQIFSSSSFVESAKALVKRTKQMAHLQQYESPFYLKATEQGHEVPKIGKIDDTTMIIASIVFPAQ